MSWLGTQKQTEHQYFEEQLSAYLDGELPPREREEMEQHLSTCPSCRWSLETLRQTVQWTSELPTLRVPRTFMIPVPAEPARARRRWRLVPVLQGATALVALLLVFVIAGDVMLTGSLPLSAPALPVVSLSTEATMPVEAPAPGAVVVETVVVEKEAEALMMQEAPAVEEPVETEDSAKMLQVAPAEAATVTAVAEMRATMAPPGMGGGTEASPEALTEGSEAETSPVPAADTRAAEATLALEAPAVLPTPTALPTLVPEPTVAAMAAPSAEVAVGEEVSPPAALQGREWEYGGRPAFLLWLRWGEYVLGVLLIVLVGTTIGAMVWRRSRRR